jgi:hypothetical protein
MLLAIAFLTCTAVLLELFHRALGAADTPI